MQELLDCIEKERDRGGIVLDSNGVWCTTEICGPIPAIKGTQINPPEPLNLI